MTVIQNPELKELDRKILDFYTLSERYLYNSNNQYGRQIYKAQLTELLKEAERIEPSSEFDMLISRNILSNLVLNDLVIDYFTDPNFSLSVEAFFTIIAGKGAWEYLEQKVRNPLDELEWKYNEGIQKRASLRISQFTDEAKEAAKLHLPNIKKVVLEYGKVKGYLPEDFDINTLFIPPKEGQENSSWQSATHTLNLASYCFEFLNLNSRIVAKPGYAYVVAFHEIIGHAANDVSSRCLPNSIRFEETNSITPTKPIVEGIANYGEEEGFKFLRENKDELGITEEEIELIEFNAALGHYSLCQSMYCALIKDKELRDKDFDGYKHILELTNSPITARNFKLHFDQGFVNKWRTFGHTLGKFHYQRMVDRVKQKFGQDYLEKNKKDFHEATLKGVWSWVVYPEAVCYFLKK